MDPAVKLQLELTDIEGELLRELLEHKKVELSHVIHHTATLVMRRELERRLETVEELLRRLRPA